MLFMFLFIFFFKQKTAYEMRISDWSSDVCSSDLIVEPIAGNMNLVKPTAGFLEGLRTLCTQHGALLVFDEVMTGFRAGPQGVQGLTGEIGRASCRERVCQYV